MDKQMLELVSKLGSSDLCAYLTTMRQKDAECALTAALVAARAEMPVMTKDAKGAHYKYMTLDAFVNAVTPILTKHGLVLSWSSEIKEERVEVTAYLHHVDGYYLDADVTLPMAQAGRAQNAAQAVGSLLTYGKRYSAAMVLGFGTGEDDDGVASAGPSAPGPTQSFSASSTSAKSPAEMQGNPLGRPDATNPETWVETSGDEDDIPFATCGYASTRSRRSPLVSIRRIVW